MPFLFLRLDWIHFSSIIFTYASASSENRQFVAALFRERQVKTCFICLFLQDDKLKRPKSISIVQFNETIESIEDLDEVKEDEKEKVPSRPRRDTLTISGIGGDNKYSVLSLFSCSFDLLSLSFFMVQ